MSTSCGLGREQRLGVEECAGGRCHADIVEDAPLHTVTVARTSGAKIPLNVPDLLSFADLTAACCTDALDHLVGLCEGVCGRHGLPTGLHGAQTEEFTEAGERSGGRLAAAAAEARKLDSEMPAVARSRCRDIPCFN